MSRPEKPRQICELPLYSMYGPKGKKARDSEKVIMKLDELETIRLLDYEGMNQEEAAKQMNVARTTIQRIYNEARKKIAESIIEGKVIVFEGGEYVLCGDDCENCDKHHNFRRKRHQQMSEE